MEIRDAYKFCPRCGAQGKSDDYRLSCPGCGLSTYFSPKPVQEIVLENAAGEILLCVRAADPGKGLLDFPGGFVEPDETFEESVRREVKEELGIDIDVNDFEYLSSSFNKYPYQGIDYPVVGTSFLAKLPAGAKIRPGDDVADVEFYKLEDVPMDRLAWPPDVELIKLLKKRKSKRH
ncbi:MAG TPA: NUDIX domain-containing protein [Candidatus Saccharimonadales bacterium]|nr:NUDIX domain-containing protein [Candidatus Saccharimonadales bacterium]